MTQVLAKALEKAKKVICPWCAQGDPMSLDNDGVDRRGRYHSFYGGNRECKAAFLQAFAPTPKGEPIRDERGTIINHKALVDFESAALSAYKEKRRPDEVVKWLRDFRRNAYNSGFLHLASDAEKHADTIEILTRERDEARAALRPFADLLTSLGFVSSADTTSVVTRLNVGDLRNAHSALSPAHSEETFAGKIARLNREIGEREAELQLLVCGDPMKGVSFPAHSEEEKG